MAHFLAATGRLRLGSAATLVGFHNPVEVAEDLATLAALAPGRVMAGFARGGPFESQNQAFGVDPDESRARMREAVPAIVRLLSGQPDSHRGRHYAWDTLHLHPVAPRIPVFLASADDETLRLAAHQGYGLMGAQFWPVERLRRLRDTFIDAHPDGAAPDLMVSRGLFIDDDPQRARERALAHIHDFRAQKAQLWGNRKGPMADVPDTVMLERMLVGTPDEVLRGALELRHMGVTRLALNPLSWDMDTRRTLIERYMREVHPRVMETGCCECVHETGLLA
jgi:alkanesulfonate monooxygenase SsuD/methylene tetrahydromethanopterin reductase-like flavin-dependent oxidoreductase (luciferase family)